MQKPKDKMQVDVNIIKEIIKTKTEELTGKGSVGIQSFFTMTYRSASIELKRSSSYAQNTLAKLKLDPNIAFIKKDTSFSASVIGFKYVDSFVEKLIAMSENILQQYTGVAATIIKKIIDECVENSFTDSEDITEEFIIKVINTKDLITKILTDINKVAIDDYAVFTISHAMYNSFTSVLAGGVAYEVGSYEKKIVPASLMFILERGNKDMFKENLTLPQKDEDLTLPVEDVLIKEDIIVQDKLTETEIKPAPEATTVESENKQLADMISRNMNEFKLFAEGFANVISDCTNAFDAKIGVDAKEVEELKESLDKSNSEIIELKDIIAIKEEEIREHKEKASSIEITEDKIQDAIGKASDIIRNFNNMAEYKKGLIDNKNKLESEVIDAIMSILE